MYDEFGIAGTHLDKTFVEDPRRPVDQVLRWHFRQAVLANMRGQGEPIFESDFPWGYPWLNYGWFEGWWTDGIWAIHPPSVV